LNAEDYSLNSCGNLEFTDEDGTLWEVDPSDGRSRHWGSGMGAFWKDWE